MSLGQHDHRRMLAWRQLSTSSYLFSWFFRKFRGFLRKLILLSNSAPKHERFLGTWWLIIKPLSPWRAHWLLFVCAKREEYLAIEHETLSSARLSLNLWLQLLFNTFVTWACYSGISRYHHGLYFRTGRQTQSNAICWHNVPNAVKKLSMKFFVSLFCFVMRAIIAFNVFKKPGNLLFYFI